MKVQKLSDVPYNFNALYPDNEVLVNFTNSPAGGVIDFEQFVNDITLYLLDFLYG